MSDKWGNLALRRAFKAANVDDELADTAAASTITPDRLAAKQEATEGKLHGSSAFCSQPSSDCISGRSGNSPP